MWVVLRGCPALLWCLPLGAPESAPRADRGAARLAVGTGRSGRLSPGSSRCERGSAEGRSRAGQVPGRQRPCEGAVLAAPFQGSRAAWEGLGVLGSKLSFQQAS